MRKDKQADVHPLVISHRYGKGMTDELLACQTRRFHELTVDENLRIARRSGHTRFPLCEGDLDHVIGLIHIKDVFRRDRPLNSLKEVARDIAFVPETLELDRLLKRMRTERFHLAAVIDEYMRLKRGVSRGDARNRAGRSRDVLLRADDIVHDDDAPTQAEVLHKAFRGAEILYTLRLGSGAHPALMSTTGGDR